MKQLAFMNSPTVYLEINQDFLRALKGEATLELPLERAENGRITGPCKERLASGLKAFLNQKSWQSRLHAICAVGANGVSLRRLTLPVASGDELHRLLLMQIESEFPLPPNELAWGYRPIGKLPVTAGPARQEILVAAVKKEALEEYADLLFKCGMNPVFTLAAIARSALCPEPAGTYAILELGRHRSELMTFEQGIPGQVRIFSWGEEATKDDASLDTMAKTIAAAWAGRKLFISGEPGYRRDLAAQLSRRLMPATECVRLETTPGGGGSVAIAGLRKTAAQGGGVPPLMLQVQSKQADGAFNWNEATFRKWAVAAVIMLCAVLLLPYAEAIVLKPFLTRKLAAFQSQAQRLPAIDTELDFLQYLRQNQPPYLDALYLFAKSAPQGSRFDSLSLTRRGEISMHGSMPNFQQLADFRAKLIESGFFSDVTVEEQTPSPDRQKVNVRISAQWADANARASLSVGPSAEEIEKAKDNAGKMPGGMSMPPGMSPTGFPAGVPLSAMPPTVRGSRPSTPGS
jgi:hypothetical protein